MNLVFHIGYPKTATTLLQRHIYPAWEGVNYIDHYKKENKWLLELRYVNEPDFEASLYVEKLSQLIQPDKVNVISIESWVGDVFKRGFNTVRNLRYLKSIAPEARIIITIREQCSMIEAIYKQYVNQGGTCGFQDFLSLPPPKPVSFDFSYLNYYRIFELYEKEFGQNHVSIIPYEMIKSDPEEFLQKLAEMMGSKTLPRKDMSLKVNPSLSGLALNILRLSNYFLSTPLQPCNPVRISFLHPRLRKFLQKNFQGNSRISLISPEQKAYFQDLYRESNRLLVQKTGLDLASYGYAL